MTEPHGYVDPAFTHVRDVFADLLAKGDESGAGLAVFHEGRPVVDLVGGWRDADRTLPWTPETVVAVYSVGKPFAAFCLLLLVDRGRVGLDDAVHDYWPEFPDDGTTLRHVLAHTAGRPVFPVERPAKALADWDLLAADLAATPPMWTPGTVAAEHALTYGHLIGEVVRRVDGRTIGAYLIEEIARPWSLDLSFGATTGKAVADLVYGDPDWKTSTLGDPDGLKHRGLANPHGCLDLDVVNGPLWRDTEVPAVNMHATATAIARFYNGLLAGGVLDGHRLVSESTVAEMVRVQHAGDDALLGNPVKWALGVQVDDDGSWGMGGIGGNVGYAMPPDGFTIGYVTRHLADFERVGAIDTAVTDVVKGRR